MEEKWPRCLPEKKVIVRTESSARRGGAATQLQDLPDAVVATIISMVGDTRTRNAMSLVCRKWLALERSTRTSLSLRGNVRDLYLIPTCFRQVTHLDLSLLSPWGYFHLDDGGRGGDSMTSSSSSSALSMSYQSSNAHQLIAHRLAQAFPALTSLTVYARTPSTLRVLAPHFPLLHEVKLVRWHQRSQSPLGSDFVSLFRCCPQISSLDLSHFYCWTEDLPPALQEHPSAAASLTRLNLLLTASSLDGFKSQELIAISKSCPNLEQLRASCVFNPRYVDFVGDDALRVLASNCPRLTLLHLAGARTDAEGDGLNSDDARISRSALDDVFGALPQLQELTLDVCQNVRDAGPALELLNLKCPRLKSLALGQFLGICRGNEWQLDGVSLCEGLESLSIGDSADLTDSSLHAISRGCQRLTKFAIRGCKQVTEQGMKSFAGMLRKTLVDISILDCEQLPAAASLRALEPIRERIHTLDIECNWDGIDGHDVAAANNSSGTSQSLCYLDLNSDIRHGTGEFDYGIPETANRKRRYLEEAASGGWETSGGGRFFERSWKCLRYLSLRIQVGEPLSHLPIAGLESCPELEEVRIKVEGDCRRRAVHMGSDMGLSCLERYPRLHRMRLDCGDTIGYALTAPHGHSDLSMWERFFLKGIGILSLDELDYWPPQDREVNNRSLSLPAAGLLATCLMLRKLFIHGTAYEHFMMFFINIPNLRDVQLRADYYPAPEDDMSTEVRVDSCSRFEDTLNSRRIPD